MIFVKNSRGGREVNMINTVSKIVWEGGVQPQFGYSQEHLFFQNILISLFYSVRAILIVCLAGRKQPHQQNI